MHGALEKRHPGECAGLKPASRVSQHVRSEVERDHGLKLLGQVGQQRPSPASEVSGGLPSVGRDFCQFLPERVHDVGPVRVEKNLVVTRFLAVPVLSLLLNRFLSQGETNLPLMCKWAGRLSELFSSAT